jgi:hypothetical protein
MSDAQPGGCDAQRRAGAERMRATRERRRKGLRIVLFAVRDTEIEALVRHGLLAHADRNDRSAIAVALGRLLDRML